MRLEGLKVKKNIKLHNIKLTYQVLYHIIEKLCLRDISIHTNFNQNRSIKVSARKIKVVIYDLR